MSLQAGLILSKISTLSPRWIHHSTFVWSSRFACAHYFTQNRNFIKDVTGRNKNYHKYQLWANNEFIIPPSSGALALHALIISLKPSGKIVKLQNECTEFSQYVKFRSKLFNSSLNFDLKISCALPPYYSLEMSIISSTSHSILSRAPGSAF